MKNEDNSNWMRVSLPLDESQRLVLKSIRANLNQPFSPNCCFTFARILSDELAASRPWWSISVRCPLPLHPPIPCFRLCKKAGWWLWWSMKGAFDKAPFLQGHLKNIVKHYSVMAIPQETITQSKENFTDLMKNTEQMMLWKWYRGQQWIAWIRPSAKSISYR